MQSFVDIRGGVLQLLFVKGFTHLLNNDVTTDCKLSVHHFSQNGKKYQRFRSPI